MDKYRAGKLIGFAPDMYNLLCEIKKYGCSYDDWQDNMLDRIDTLLRRIDSTQKEGENNT